MAAIAARGIPPSALGKSDGGPVGDGKQLLLYVTIRRQTDSTSVASKPLARITHRRHNTAVGEHFMPSLAERSERRNWVSRPYDHIYFFTIIVYIVRRT